ncbi:MAG TPA: AAA family ATPase [Acidimicrobiia bacterium]|nr:AAA family ATPase [Acidimicrobiia bacterium]
MSAEIPTADEAEKAVIGSMVMSREAAEVAMGLLTPDDFYLPLHGDIFNAFLSCHSKGDPLDAMSIAAEMGIGKSAAERTEISKMLIGYMGTEGWLSSSIARYCQLVVDADSRRKILSASIEVSDLARSGTAPASEILVRARELIDGVDVETTAFMPEGLSTLDEFFDRPDEVKAPWVIPGMLRRNWRIMIVGGEGAGKSVLLRQMAISAAAGLHPLTHRAMPPQRALIVDLENPDEAVEEVCAPMKATAEERADWDPDRCWLWHQPQGINLRRRADRVAFESVLRMSQPDIVCFGPVYKSFVSSQAEDEASTGEVQHVLDDLRIRHNFGLLLEHHAPHGQDGSKRKMRPHGSVRWQRWPEMGISMIPVKGVEGSFELGRFRGDRVKATWPTRVDRSGSSWPWAGVFPTGTFARDAVTDEPEGDPDEGLAEADRYF